MTFVARERIDLTLSIDTGLPLTLTLELIHDNEARTTITAPDPRLELGDVGYRYSFVPTDTDVGIWRYRWWGTDSTGVEFAWPQHEHWNTISIE